MVGAVKDMDMVAFSQITDHIFVRILHSTEPELEDARNILRNILRRKLYKFIGQTQLKANQVLSKVQYKFKLSVELNNVHVCER